MTQSKPTATPGNGLNTWIRIYIIPTLVLVVTLASAWVRMEAEYRDQQRRIDGIELDIKRLFDFGSKGFRDHQVRGGNDLHSEHWHRSVFGNLGWRKLQQEFSTQGDYEAILKASEEKTE